MRARRKVVQPNVGFWKQLGQFEEQLLGRSTIAECIDIKLMEEELKQRLEQKKSANGNGDSKPASADNAAAAATTADAASNSES